MAKNQNERYTLKQGYFPDNGTRQDQPRPAPKKLFILIAVCVLSVCVIAAGIVFVPKLLTGTQPVTNQGWSAADLVGSWASEENEGSSMIATVSENTIAIYWHSEDTDALYWKGSFPVTGGAEQEKTVISDAGPENATALLASSDPQKTFTVRTDSISFKLTALGVTTKVTLKKVNP